MATEEPAFKHVIKDGDFEIRDYPEMVAPDAAPQGGRQAAINEGFRLIADYIFGNNRQNSQQDAIPATLNLNFFARHA